MGLHQQWRKAPSGLRTPLTFNWLELVWADGGYNARQVEHAVAAQPPLRVEIVKRPDDSSGFIVLPRRWVVKRTFSWFGRNRRLAKDYEKLADALRRLHHPRLHPHRPQAARQAVDFMSQALSHQSITQLV